MINSLVRHTKSGIVSFVIVEAFLMLLSIALKLLTLGIRLIGFILWCIKDFIKTCRSKDKAPFFPLVVDNYYKFGFCKPGEDPNFNERTIQAEYERNIKEAHEGFIQEAHRLYNEGDLSEAGRDKMIKDSYSDPRTIEIIEGSYRRSRDQALERLSNGTQDQYVASTVFNILARGQGLDMKSGGSDYRSSMLQLSNQDNRREKHRRILCPQCQASSKVVQEMGSGNQLRKCRKGHTFIYSYIAQAITQGKSNHRVQY